MKKETFWEHDPHTCEFVQHEGERWLWGGRVYFVYSAGNARWYTVEAVTGQRVSGVSARTKRDALVAAEKQLEAFKGGIEEAVAHHVERNGRSPWKGGGV